MDYTSWSSSGVISNFDVEWTPVIKEKEDACEKYPDKYSFEGTDVCYKDGNGKEYTGKDFFDITRNKEAADHLFEMVDEKSLESYLERSSYFWKCKRCGAWHYFDPFRDMFTSRRKEYICSFCTPIRSGGIIHLTQDYYEDDRKLFSKKVAVMNPGVTTLVGCNGIGKSSFINAAKDYLKSVGQPCIVFDNLSDNGGQKNVFGSLNDALHSGKTDDLAFAAGLFASSEGERIGAALASFCTEVREYAKRHEGYGEIWVLFDAIDSGLSVNVLSFIKEVLVKKMISDLPEGMLAYVIFSCNSWEMAEGTNCFLIDKMKYSNIGSYPSFKKAVFSSQKAKEERDRVLQVKADIQNQAHTFTFNQEVCDEKVPGENVGAVLEQNGYTLKFIVRTSKSRDSRNFFKLFKTVDGEQKPVKIKDFEFDSYDFFHIRKDALEKEMKDCVCRQIFLEQRKA